MERQGIEKKIGDIDKKIPNFSDLLRKTYYKTNIIHIESKISRVTGLVTIVALNAAGTEIENKIPTISNLDTKVVATVPKAQRLKIKYLILLRQSGRLIMTLKLLKTKYQMLVMMTKKH